MDRKQKKGQLVRDATMGRLPKFSAPILGELCEEVPLTAKMWKLNLEQAWARTITENEKDNNKACVCSITLSLSLSLSLSRTLSLSPSLSFFSRRFMSLCLAKAVNAFFKSCLSLLDDY